MVRVTVLKFGGHTGLRPVNSSYFLPDDQAARLEKGGYVRIEKELKTVIETKELKTKRTTKKRK